MPHIIIGTFGNKDAAQSALERLAQDGFRNSEVDRAGTKVSVTIGDTEAERVETALRAAGAVEVRRAQPSGGFDPANPHSSPADFGEEGGSSQWGQTVLRVRNGESEVAERTVSRDGGSKKLD